MTARKAAPLLLIVCSILIGLGLAELIYREIEPEDQREAFAYRSYSFFQYDETLGWKNTPNTKGVLERSEFKTNVRINSDGMRYHEVPPKKGFRVAVLGDSYVWGNGVEEEERFTDLVEKRTGSEILNFGVVAYNPLQYYLQLDLVLAFKPDLVVIGFYLGNDFENHKSFFTNFRPYYRPYAQFVNKKLVINGIPVANPACYASAPLQLLQFALGRLFYRALPACDNNERDELFSPPKKGSGFRFHSNFSHANVKSKQSVKLLTKAILKAIKDKLDAKGVPLIVFAIPSDYDLQHPWPGLMLKRITEASNIKLVSGLEKDLVIKDYYPVDGHWKVQGHRKAAAFLTPVIRSYKESSERRHVKARP